MELGIGLPATIPGTSGFLVLEWAERADSGPFSSLGILDRLAVRQMFDIAKESWRAEGREGRPRLVATLYYALGPEAERGGDYIRDYYAYIGPAADDAARSIPSSPRPSTASSEASRRWARTR